VCTWDELNYWWCCECASFKGHESQKKDRKEDKNTGGGGLACQRPKGWKEKRSGSDRYKLG